MTEASNKYLNKKRIKTTDMLYGLSFGQSAVRSPLDTGFDAFDPQLVALSANYSHRSEHSFGFGRKGVLQCAGTVRSNLVAQVIHLHARQSDYPRFSRYGFTA